MAKKVFVVITSRDKEVSAGVGIRYAFNAATKPWMDEVKIIVFGPSEEAAAHDTEIQAKLKDAMKAGIEVLFCKACSDEQGVTGILEEAGFKVIYVGPVISQLLKDGWYSLTF